MRFSLLLFLLFSSLVAKEKDSFITEQEYAEHLYKNPRGIGCDKCHGKRGEGMVIAPYKEKGERKFLKTGQINSLQFRDFKAALEEKRSVMPKYFLTDKEVISLYNYLHIQE